MNYIKRRFSSSDLGDGSDDLRAIPGASAMASNAEQSISGFFSSALGALGLSNNPDGAPSSGTGGASGVQMHSAFRPPSTRIGSIRPDTVTSAGAGGQSQSQRGAPAAGPSGQNSVAGTATTTSARRSQFSAPTSPTHSRFSASVDVANVGAATGATGPSFRDPSAPTSSVGMPTMTNSATSSSSGAGTSGGSFLDQLSGHLGFAKGASAGPPSSSAAGGVLPTASAANPSLAGAGTSAGYSRPLAGSLPPMSFAPATTATATGPVANVSSGAGNFLTGLKQQFLTGIDRLATSTSGPGTGLNHARILLVIDEPTTDWAKYFRGRRLPGDVEIRVEQVT